MSGSAPRSLSRRLLICSVGLATLLATAGELGLVARDTGIGRLGEIRLVRPLLTLVDAAWPGALASQAELLQRPHDLADAGTLRLFAMWVTLIHLAGFSVVALLARPFLRLPSRVWPGVWPGGLPVALIAVALAVVLRIPLSTSALILPGILALTLTAGLALVAAAHAGPGARLAQGSRLRSAIGRAATGFVLLGLATLLAGGAVEAAHHPEPGRVHQPNILLVSIDSLRADHLGCYGYGRPTSPNLDAIASEGVRFATVLAPAPWTLPSHVSLMTSLPPEIHRVTLGDRRLSSGVPTLPAVLRGAGYETWGVVAAHFLRARYGYSRGFDRYDDTTLAAAGADLAHRQVTSPVEIGLAENLLENWNEGGRQRPFFLFLHLWDVHYDYNPPAPYATLFDPDYQGSLTAASFRADIDSQAPTPLSDREQEHVIALYDGEIRFTDLWLGRLVERLRELGVLDHTIVAITADHGEEFFEHGHKGHGKALFEESVRVPLIVRYPPALAPGRVVQDTARLVDVAPTLLGLAGVRPPAGFGDTSLDPAASARDLGPLLRGLPFEPAPAFLELYGASRAVRARRFKLIQTWKEGDAGRLFDLGADPGELVDLAGRGLPAEAALRHMLAEWQVATQSRELTPDERKLTDAERQTLRSLGYTQ